MIRFAVIGPTFPYRGGIAHYTTLLARHLRKEFEVLLISFSRQYPGWLFPGKSDRDPSERPLQTAAEYLLDPLNPLTWSKTFKRLQTWEPDVVIIPWWHPYFAPAWSWLGRKIKRLPLKPKLIFICHNVLPHEQGFLSQFIMPTVLKTTLRPADGYIVHSRADGQILGRLVFNARYQVTPLPAYEVSDKTDTPGIELPVDLPADRSLLLFCGLVRPYKGLDVLLDALAIAIQRRPLHLLVAGEFWRNGESQYRQQIERLNLGSQVTILNEYLPDGLLSACINRSDVVVLPYRSATQSAVIQMAFGHGKPVITTDVGGLGEVVAHGQTGLVVPPEDPQALATAIIRYFEGNLATIYGKNIGQERARFSWENYIQQITGLLTPDGDKDIVEEKLAIRQKGQHSE